MFDSDHYRCQGTIFQPIHRLDEAAPGIVSREDNGFLVDVQDKGNHYLLEAELPGFVKNDLDLTVNGPYLTIRARRGGGSGEVYSRCFDVANIDTKAITAIFDEELLSVELPKKQG